MGGFTWRGSGEGAHLGLLELRSCCWRHPVVLFPNTVVLGVFFQDFQFCKIINTHVLGNSQKTYIPFLF